jgi:hypothetical protein
MALEWFKPTISASERPKTHELDRAATGTGIYNITRNNFYKFDIQMTVHRDIFL